MQSEVGHEAGNQRVHHRHLDTGAFAGLLSFVECRDDCTIKVDATKKIGDGWTGLDRLLVRVPGDAQHARHRLHREVHGGEVAIGPFGAITIPGRNHEPGVCLVQRIGAKIQPCHNAGCVVLDQDIGLADQFEENLTPHISLEIQDKTSFVRVENGKRLGCSTRIGSASQMLSVRRLNFYHIGASHRHQKGRIRSVVNLGEVKHNYALQRSPGRPRRFICHLNPFQYRIAAMRFRLPSRSSVAAARLRKVLARKPERC